MSVERPNWKNVPNSYFVGKHVSIPLPSYDPILKEHLVSFAWIKVTGTWGNWLVGTFDSTCERRPDIQEGATTHFAKEDIDRVLGQSGR